MNPLPLRLGVVTVLGVGAVVFHTLSTGPGRAADCIPQGRWAAVHGDSVLPANFWPDRTVRIGAADYIVRVDEVCGPRRLLLESVAGHIRLEAACETGGASVDVMTFTAAPAFAPDPSDPATPSELRLFRDPLDARAAAQAYGALLQQFLARIPPRFAVDRARWDGFADALGRLAQLSCYDPSGLPPEYAEPSVIGGTSLSIGGCAVQCGAGSSVTLRPARLNPPPSSTSSGREAAEGCAL